MLPDKAKSRFEFTGGNLCLDFANTVDHRGSREHRKELLTDYVDLLRWGREAGVVSTLTAEQLHQLADESPGHAQTAFHYAVQLREGMYSIFSAVAERRGVSGAAMNTLNVAIQQAGEHARIVYGNRNFRWEWFLADSNLNSMLWPVARAAAQLLTSEELAYVRKCASEPCGWLFLDKTKNHRRRWCEMRTCGNRDKARRYYQRNKS